MNCGAWGAQVWLKEVDWAPIEDLLDQSSVPWFSHDEIAGRIKSQDNVVYAIVYGAGHMVPVDQPERAYDLISEFVDSL
jgi:carboxypeptidase C (cathepsin A)